MTSNSGDFFRGACAIGFCHQRRCRAVSGSERLGVHQARGGVGAGARALGMAQPNASRALRRLERLLRLTLLVRTPTGTVLTRDGALVVDWARRVLDANQRLILAASAIGRGHLGTVRVEGDVPAGLATALR